MCEHKWGQVCLNCIQYHFIFVCLYHVLCVCVCVCSCVYIVLHMHIRSVPYYVCALGLYCVACVFHLFCAVGCLGLICIVYHMSMPHYVYLLVCLYCLCVHL